MSEIDKTNFMLVKRLVLKLGSRCNLHCKYCHQSEHDYQFNNDILAFLGSLPLLEQITFSGGEPLLYQKEIQACINATQHNNVKYKILTNGTLLNEETVDWINRNGIIIGISFDGYNNMRGAIPNFEMLNKVNNYSGISTVVTNKFDYNKFYNDIQDVMQKCNKDLISLPNFIHQTQDSPNLTLVDDISVQQYIQFVCQELYFEKKLLDSGVDASTLPFYKILSMTYQKSLLATKGVRCCNNEILHLTAEGNFMLCGYGNNKIGDIYSGVDFTLVDSFIPKRCQGCNYWNVCRCYCVANITDNECNIFRAIYDCFVDLFGEVR